LLGCRIASNSEKSIDRLNVAGPGGRGHLDFYRLHLAINHDEQVYFEPVVT
jgi:hypothetical protein